MVNYYGTRGAKRAAVMTVTALISLYCVSANGGKYSILLTKTDPTSATAAMDSLSELGYMPLRIEQHDALSAIVGGDYNLYLDALIDARILKSRGFVGQVYRKSSTPGNISLKLPGVPSLVPPEGPISLDMDEQRRICLIVDSKPTIEAMQALEFESASTSIDDPKNGYLTLRLAYLHLRNKARSEAEVHLHKIVECKVAAPKDVWLESVNRLAHIKHAKAERLDAYKLYRILASHALSDKQRDEALVEIAGLMLELVRSEKGTYEDFRLFCDDALQVVVSGSKRERVTLALMAAESYYHESEYQTAIDNLSAIIDSTTNVEGVAKEIGMALIFRGQSYAQLGDYARAKADFQKAHNLPYPEGVAWKHIPNMRVFALQYLKKLAVDFDMPFDQEGDF